MESKYIVSGLGKTFMLADSEENLYQMPLSLTNTLQKFKPKTNSKIKKILIGNSEMRSNIDIKIEYTRLQQVKQFYY